MKQAIRFLMIAASLSWALAGFGESARVPSEVVRALGTTRGKAVDTGLVFIDGKYLRAPYRVTRSGNQILVNDHPVTGQLISWEKFLETQPASKLKETEIPDPDGASENSAPVEDGADPAAPKDGGNAPSAAVKRPSNLVVTIVEPRLAADADDLDDFDPKKSAPDKMKLTDIPPDSEADKARQKRAEDEKKEEAEEKAREKAEESEEKGEGEQQANDSSGGENEEELDPASPEGEAAAKRKAAAAAKAAKPAVKTRKVVTLDGKFEMNFRAQKLMKPIETYRTRLESTLRRGGYLFFGTGAKPYCHGRTSDAASAKELLKKLPELMGAAYDDSEGFCDAARSFGLMSYITLQIAQDLYRHKMDSVYLKQRRRELNESDNLKKMLNNGR